MADFLFQFGYLGLFVISFLAATILPLSSEIFVSLMIVGGGSSMLVFMIALTGNYLGAATNYFLGKYGEKFILSKYIKTEPQKNKKAELLYKKYGAPLLFFSWIPIIGDPLCIIPGIFHLDFRIFSFWIILGKAFRYILVIKLAGIIIAK